MSYAAHSLTQPPLLAAGVSLVSLLATFRRSRCSSSFGTMCYMRVCSPALMLTLGVNCIRRAFLRSTQVVLVLSGNSQTFSNVRTVGQIVIRSLCMRDARGGCIKNSVILHIFYLHVVIKHLWSLTITSRECRNDFRFPSLVATPLNEWIARSMSRQMILVSRLVWVNKVDRIVENYREQSCFSRTVFVTCRYCLSIYASNERERARRKIHNA